MFTGPPIDMFLGVHNFNSAEVGINVLHNNII